MAAARPPMVLLPATAARKVQDWASTWGSVDVRGAKSEDLVVVSGISKRQVLRLPTQAPWLNEHYLRYAESFANVGAWYRTKSSVHDIHLWALARGAVIPTATLRETVEDGWRVPTKDRSMLVLCWSKTDDGPVWSAWWVSTERAVPGLLELVEDRSPLEYLGDAWPAEKLAKATAVAVGVGSIGSVVAETIASYAVGRLVLIDPDRLLHRNLVRHRLGIRDLGRFKVSAMADQLRHQFPDMTVEAHPIDVITDADIVRSLLKEADVVIGATDGVAARRVVNHLARRANIPAVLACVLESGALGEIVRVRPGTGCLLCFRARLVEEGSMDPEPDLDPGYGLGTPQLPMTAVAGDLAIVGTHAAKTAVATILERQGDWAQRLPGDVAVLGLRPVPDLPAPFDIECAGDVRWTDIGPSRPDCPTCGTA